MMTRENEPCSNVQSVQPRTTEYAEGEEGGANDRSNQKPQQAAPLRIESRDVIVSFRITRSLADRVEFFKSLHHKKNKTEAFAALLEIALYIQENAQRLNDPAIVKYFQENLYNVQLIDDITEWPQDRIEAIIGVLASERERRFRLKIGRR
jgi:hypothetical protein